MIEVFWEMWQTAHEVNDMQEELDVFHEYGSDVVPNMTREAGAKYITYYEDGVSLPGKRTAVWEIDKGMLSFVPPFVKRIC